MCPVGTYELLFYLLNIINSLFIDSPRQEVTSGHYYVYFYYISELPDVIVYLTQYKDTNSPRLYHQHLSLSLTGSHSIVEVLLLVWLYVSA